MRSAARMRYLLARTLPDRADVRRHVMATDAIAGRVVKDELPETGLAAKAFPAKAPMLGQEGARPVSVNEFTVVLADPTGNRAPSELDIRAQDMLQLLSGTFRVIGTDGGRSDALCLTCEAIRVQD